AVLLVVVHFAWARKANLATLSGDIALPLAAGAAALALLVLRVPAVRRWISGRRVRRNVSGGKGGGEVLSPPPLSPAPPNHPPS
ncbi:MAG: hypothetical protein HW404_1375, partial [Anaerolineales bacterium]|nr:hypothetical protein [Anaerolineales bacterium]